MENGRSTLPSVVKIQTNGDPPLVGNAALRAQFPWPKLALYDAKRLIGNKVTDGEVLHFLKDWPFDIVADSQGNPLYRIPLHHTNEVKLYRPEEIS